MGVLVYVYLMLCAIVLFFLVLPFLTIFFSRFRKEKFVPILPDHSNFDFGCIITAYKNAEITKPLIHSILKQKHQNFHIYLVADACDVADFDILNTKFTLLNPQPSLNLKAKSIIHGMDNYIRNHDFTVVFDGDNLAHPDFLKVMNKYANAGYEAIQGQRTAKNLDTVYACMDALGEFYKNYIDRYAPYLIGSSAVISGSGMAVESKLYKAYLNSPEIEQGKHLWKKMLQEDKILQNFLLRSNHRIAYASDAICYDEKVGTAEAVETQRSRWLFSYFQNMKNALGIIRLGMLKLSFNQFFFGLITIAPPLFIQLLLAFVLALIGLWINPMISLYMCLAVLIFIATILWSLKLSKVPQSVWKAVWSLPVFVFKQMTALLKMGNPNKNFKHTEHRAKVDIDDIISKK